nr:PREDICTED: nuclear hormone receptor FTZ-F1 beta isoform X1 [Bemisia tabaci]XP_018911413.1 PREDICTED: nuclear hormone receptor FTZ-F1 beta isoform X1 [Bemisia tabaci]
MVWGKYAPRCEGPGGSEPVKMSGWAGRGAHSVVSSGNVTVTSINVSNDSLPDPNDKGIKHEENKCSVLVSPLALAEEDEGSASDSEISRIDFSAAAIMRNKNRDNQDECVERPMSWEGELSDSEMDTVKKEPADVDKTTQRMQVCNDVNTSDDGKPPPLKFTSESMVNKVLEQVRASKLSNPQTELPLLVEKVLGNNYSRLCNPSPDSAIHSFYSPTQSPVTSRHGLSSSPCTFTPSLSRNNSDASQYDGSQHSSCYSYSYSSVSVSPTQFSPTHSPIQRRHSQHSSRSLPEYSPDEGGLQDISEGGHSTLSVASGISRQQLINSPCPVCGDKISGFHYGIFSCESCKGFFKRTVQNRKNYVCLRGSSCPVTVATRKKCPACRFEKCLNMGMKLEAIREDRTRGGRSTYQCSYTLPSSLQLSSGSCHYSSDSYLVKQEQRERLSPQPSSRLIPPLLQEIMEVEHLWLYNENENSHKNGSRSSSSASSEARGNNNGGPDFISNLCHIADDRLYKIVKWCKSLPLFKNISNDDQISLLINAWCELLLFSCCYRSIASPGEIRVSLGKSISLDKARELKLDPCIERMLTFTEHLRRLRVDRYEYVAMKVIVLLTSDESILREPEKVRASQEKALQALQHYTLAHYPDIPSKFGELLLRIPELQRTCQVGKDMLSIKHREGEGPSFHLLMELLRGDH